MKSIFAEIKTTCPEPLAQCKITECEKQLSIGLFFDGTDNNKTDNNKTDNNENDPDKKGLDTNIARLFDAYKEDKKIGFFKYYVSGVGTTFYEINRKKAEVGGGPLGVAGDDRVIYGLFELINSAYLSLGLKQKFKEVDYDVLLGKYRVPELNEKYPLDNDSAEYLLQKFGLKYSLNQYDLEGMQAFFDKLSQEATQLIAQGKPKIVGIYLDVFGFSRGAAQARVFVNWLHKLLLRDGKLFGVPAYVRMLGLFDTVVSVGSVEGMLPYATGHGGRNNWARAEYLKIPPEVKNCYHIVGLHEFRNCFPLDSIAQGDSMPANCQEVYMPGAHSDVGGGYAPGDQGKGVRVFEALEGMPGEPQKDDAYKLSHLALNKMYEAACKSAEFHPSSPWIDLRSDAGDDVKLKTKFGLNHLQKITQAVEAYFHAAKIPLTLNLKEALRSHVALYLAWRYRANFKQLPSVRYAEALGDASLTNYRKGEAIFRSNVQFLVQSVNTPASTVQSRGFHANAKEIFQKMQATSVDPVVADFLDEWVHDSFAGFIGKFDDIPAQDYIHDLAEGQGYIRWRQLYAGSDEKLNGKPLNRTAAVSPMATKA